MGASVVAHSAAYQALELASRAEWAAADAKRRQQVRASTGWLIESVVSHTLVCCSAAVCMCRRRKML